MGEGGPLWTCAEDRELMGVWRAGGIQSFAGLGLKRCRRRTCEVEVECDEVPVIAIQSS